MVNLLVQKYVWCVRLFLPVWAGFKQKFTVKILACEEFLDNV